MKVVAIVPVKLNNERLPGKNIKCFDNGKPLCYYIFNTLLSISEIDEVYVYCSDESIKEYIPSQVKFKQRKTEFDTSSTKMNEILKAFSEEVDADIYVMTHATSPFVKKESIKKGLQKVMSGQYDSSLAVKKLQDFLWKDGKPFNYDLANIPRTQDLDVIYEETSGFYIYKKEIIENYGRRVGFKPYLHEVDEIESVDIDEANDFLIANSIYNSGILKQDREGLK